MVKQLLGHACFANLTAWLRQTVPPIYERLTE